LGQKFWRKVERIPAFARPMAGRALRGVSVPLWNAMLSPKSRLVPPRFRRPRAGERIHKLANAMVAAHPESMYDEILSLWRDLVPGARALPTAITDRAAWPPLDDRIERMMFLDQLFY